MDVEQEKILTILSREKKSLMIKDIAEMCGINRHAVARKLDTLEILGRVRKIEIGSAKKYSMVEAVPVSSLIDISNDLIIILNEKWEVQYLNKSAQVFFNLTDQSVTGKSMVLLHLEIFSLPEVIQGLKEFSFQKVSKIEVAIQKNGLEHWYEISIMNLSLRPGSVFIATIASNITEKIITRRKLIESEAMYRSLFENAPIPINEADFTLIKQYFDELHNSGLADIRSYFDQNPEEVKKCILLIKIRNINIKSQEDYQITKGEQTKLMKYILPFFTNKTINAFKNLFVSLYEGSDFTQFELSLVNAQGITRYFSVYLILASPFDDLSRVYISYLDITEQKSLQLHALQKHKELIGVTEEVIAHDAMIQEQINELIAERNDGNILNTLYNHLLDATHVPMIIFDSSLVITWVNSEMNVLCGYYGSYLLGKNLELLFPEEEKSGQISRISAQINGFHDFIEVPVLHQSGRIIKVQWNYIEKVRTTDGKEKYAAIVRVINL